MQRLANRPFADIAVDENFVVTHTLSIADVERLAGAAAAFDVDATALGLSTSNSFMDAAARLSWAPMWLAGVVSARFPGVGVLPIGAKVETLSAPDARRADDAGAAGAREARRGPPFDG